MKANMVSENIGEELGHRDTEALRELPEGWKLVRLQDVASWGSGGTPSRNNPQYYKGRIPWIKTGELGKGTIFDTEEHISEQAIKESSAKLFPAGAIAIAMYGATIGKTGILGVSASCNQACAIAVCKNVCRSNYLLKFLNSSVDAFKKLGQGGAQPNISQEILKQFPIPLPPLPEQERIAARLDLLLGKLKQARKRLNAMPELTKRFRKSVLAQAVSGELTEEWRTEHAAELPSAEALLATIRAERRAAWEKAELEKMKAKGKEPKDESWKEKYVEPEPVDASELAELPEGWGVLKISELIAQEKYSAAIGPFGSDLKKDDYRSEGIPLVFVKNIREASFDLGKMKYISITKAEQLSNHCVFPGEILITKMGDPPGDVCIFPNHISKAIITADCIKIKPDKKLFNTRFLYYAIMSDFIAKQILLETKGVAQQKVSLERFLSIFAPVLAFIEQSEIVRRVDELFALADALEMRVKDATVLADRLEPSILAKAFRGELSEQIPEEALEWEKTLAEIEQAASELGEAGVGKGRGGKKRVAMADEAMVAEPEAVYGGEKKKRGRPRKE